jgi:inner membrane protein
MDTLTHSLLGALVVRSAFPRRNPGDPLTNRQRMAVGAISAAFPDIDYVASWADPMIYLTLWHRSITHSFVLLPLWALLVGFLLSLAFRQRADWRFVSMLAAVAVLSHILSDLITVYGTQVLSPLSTWRASVGTTFIIDPWFTLIVLTGAIAGFGNRRKVLPRVSLAVLLGYVSAQAFFKFQALSIAEDYIARSGIKGGQATALPQPFSPLNWKMVVAAGGRYDIAYVNLSAAYSVDDTESGWWADVRRTYQAPEDLAWQRHYRYGNDMGAENKVRSLWENEQLDYFRRFAVFPTLYRIDHNSGTTCVWFTDLRYVLPYMTPPFRYGLCRDTPEVGDWQLRRLRRRDEEKAR